MPNKLMIAIFALALGAAAAEAADLIRLELRMVGKGCVTHEGKLPNGVFVNEPILRNTEKIYLYYVNLDKTLSTELKFKVNGNVELGPAICAFRREDKKNRTITVKCKTFEFDGDAAPGIPGPIGKWKRIMVRKFSDGDLVTLKMEFEKPGE